MTETEKDEHAALWFHAGWVSALTEIRNMKDAGFSDEQIYDFCEEQIERGDK